MRERKLNRLQGADYSKNGYYFVTAKVQGGEECLGEVVGEEMVLNRYGKLVQKSWSWMLQRYAYVSSPAFVVMPDHVHGIVFIYDQKVKEKVKIKPLSQLIGMFKSVASKWIHKDGYHGFRWQRSYHERIIRDSREFRAIKEYIRKNPERWHQGR